MPSFRESFGCAVLRINPLLEKKGFRLQSVTIDENKGTQQVFGSAEFLEKLQIFYPFKKKRFVRVSVAPVRLELYLDFGVGQSSYVISELHKLEGDGEFPERQHDLYKAMNEGEKLGQELERLVWVLLDCGERFFSNDPSLWDDLNKQRERFFEEQQNRDVFRAAELAFKGQDWETVTELLDGKREFLGKLEAKRLSYARKKIKTT